MAGRRPNLDVNSLYDASRATVNAIKLLWRIELRQKPLDKTLEAPDDEWWGSDGNHLFCVLLASGHAGKALDIFLGLTHEFPRPDHGGGIHNGTSLNLRL